MQNIIYGLSSSITAAGLTGVFLYFQVEIKSSDLQITRGLVKGSSMPSLR